MNLKPNVVDLSHYDNVTDWDAVKAFGILGVINKATEGPGMTDRTFAIRRPEAAKRGILYGGYHFLRPGNVDAQVEHFLDVVGDTTGLCLALDHEDPRVPLETARQFCRIIEDRVGRLPWLYSGFLIKQQIRPADHDFWSQVPLWLSHFSAEPVWPRCWDKPVLIQFSGDGLGPLPHNVPGIHIDGRGIDVDSFDGTADQLAAVWAGGQQGQTETPVDPLDPAQPAEPAAPPQVGRQKGIVATMFGGGGDTNESAYEKGLVDPTQPGVALPFHFHGARPKVRVYRGDKSVVCEIVDVGPHNTHDDYWTTGARPQAEHVDGGNGAGIDLTPVVFPALGVGQHDPDYGKMEVDWEFV